MEKKNKKIFIGVDIGGTKIRGGAVLETGEILGMAVTLPTLGSSPKKEVFGRITSVIDQVLKYNDLSTDKLAGIGLGVTGPLDNRNGVILECPQLPTLHFFPLRCEIENRYQVPVSMDNDANAMIFGESLWGAGKDASSVLGFTLGTGLGCALVIGGKILSGMNSMAGEIWPAPYQGATIEDFVSGKGISKAYFQASGKKASAEEVAVLADKRYADALNTWTLFGEALATAISWGVNFFDPERVVIGGSIAKAWDYFYSPMHSYYVKHVCPVPGLRTPLLQADLGDNAGFIGAAALCMEQPMLCK